MKKENELDKAKGNDRLTQNRRTYLIRTQKLRYLNVDVQIDGKSKRGFCGSNPLFLEKGAYFVLNVYSKLILYKNAHSFECFCIIDTV